VVDVRAREVSIRAVEVVLQSRTAVWRGDLVRVAAAVGVRAVIENGHGRRCGSI